jgi:hypothetical protein
MNGRPQSTRFFRLLHPLRLLMDGVFMNSSALHHTVRDVVKTQELSDVTLTSLIETQPEIFANMHGFVGEMKFYVVQMIAETLKVRGKV